MSIRHIIAKLSIVAILIVTMFQPMTLHEANAASFYYNKLDTFTSSGVWCAPTGITSANVRAWGAGGGGKTATGAGGGAAYAESNVTVTPGACYYVSIGVGGIGGATGANGGNTTFATTTVVAVGGSGASAGGAGGAAGASTGAITYSGGLGFVSTGNAGGGGAGCEAGNGTDGTGSGAGTSSGGQDCVGSGSFQTNIPKPMGGGGGSTVSGGANGARGEVRIRYNLPVTLDFPSIRSRRSDGTAGGVLSFVASPADGVINGDILLVIVSSRSSAVLSTSDPGWTQLTQVDSGTTMSFAVFWKKATGADPGPTILLSSSQRIQYIVYDIQGGGTPTIATTSGSSSNANPPSNTDCSNMNCLWIASALLNVPLTTGADISAPPSGFTGLLYQSYGRLASSNVAGSERWLNASSLDPGTFTSDNQAWIAATIMIPPLSGTQPITGASSVLKSWGYGFSGPTRNW